MAPPPLPTRHYGPTITSRQVTEDTPPDLLEGTMDLQVTLPSGKSIIMNVHRSTPMMDLLVQVTTAHRINPGGHIIQVVSDNIFLSYKPSTPIGQLDTSAIKIVPKNKLKDAVRNRKSNLQQQAIERNIRLKVNLPRNQLAVYRVPPRTLISDILSMVCKEKNLDEEAFEIRHPVNVDERLRGSCALSDYQLQEVCVVSRDFRPPPLSVTDLITMASIAHPDDKKRRGFLGGIFSRKAKSSTGDSSVSSGSAGERSVSPARSDESMDGRPAPRALSPAAATSATLPNNTSRIRTNVAGGLSSARLSRPVSMISLSKTKKGPAPVPPLKKSVSNFNGNVQPIKESKVSLSRHSSDSSGYHEPETKSSHASPSNSVVGTLEALSKSTPKSNLPHVSSQSMSSIASSKCKRRAPPPPTMANKAPPLAIPEEDMDNSRNISNLSIASTECSNSVETLRNYPVASREMLNSSESSVDPSDASNKEETVVISDNIKDSSTDNSPTNSKENTLKMSKDSNSGTESVENVSRCDDSKISSLNNSEGSCSKSLSDSHTSSETVTDSPFEEVMKDLSSEKINNRCSDIVVSSAVELSNGISPESSNNASLEKVQSDNNRASPYSTSIPSPDTSAIIDTSAIELPVNSPNTSVESPKVDCEEDPSVGIDSNSRQPPCSTSDNEVQTQKLSLSSETGHEYVELLNDLQRPKRQKKHRAKIPEDFAECSGDGRIYKSAEETEKSLASECEPLTNDLPVTDCLAALCDTSEPTMANTEDTYSGNMCSKTVLNGPSDNPPPLFSSSSDDFQDILNKKNSELAPTFDSDEEDSFDVNGIIEVAQLSDDTINILSEDVPDNIQSNAVNMLPEFIDEKLNVSEAFNLDVHKQIQTKDENFSNDDLCAGMYVEFPKQEESSTDPSTQTLERRKNNFTSKVELSSENDERLGLVKTPVQRSISITQISASSEERKIKEEYVKNDVISELKSNIEAASSNHSPKILTLKPKSTSDYKVVLSYNNSSSQPASLIDKRMERTDSNSSYESVSSVSNAQIKSDILVKCDRSSTETSYESAPPPLPESHVPMFSDSESKGSRSSSVSRQSSLSECDKSDFKKPQRPSGPPQPVFSISTYASRAEKISYDKKLVRSESLMSIDDIHNKKPTCVSEDSNPSKAKDDFLNRRLGRTDSKRNDFFRSEEALNKNFVLHRIMPESSKQPVLSVNCDRSKSGTNSHTVPVKSLATELDNSDHHHVQDTFRSRRSAFEQKPSPSSRHPEPIKFELGSAKDSITFSNRVVRNPTSFYLRKAKSTLDMRGAGPAADNKYGDGVAYPSGGEPALAQEYMKLQDDFMKWQQQLLQNQHVLHSKVAPIASNPPTLNNFGMTKEMGPPISQGPPQPKKPVEITIPIRFEDTGEIVGSTNETHIISRSSQENQMPTQQYSNARPAYSQFSNHSWNNPGMNIGTWEQRPAEREKEPSPTNQQSNFVNSGSRPFNRTQFAPANSGPTSGMQTVFQSTPAQLHDNRFRYQEYPEQQTLFQGAPEPPGRFQEMSQPRYQNSFQPKFQAAPDPQMRFQEAQQPRFTKEISPPRFQELPPLRYQEAPQTRYQPAPQNVTESTPQYSTRPQDFSAQNRPQMPYINGPAHSNSNNQASDKNDDNINARFTSVVTLSNDKTGDNAPKKDKVRSVVQLNNVDSEPLQGSSMFRGGPVVKGFQIKTEPQILNNEREKRSPPICSVTPMSSRLVQQAVLQPEAANSGGFRISPPRFERKSPSPPKVEQSPPPFSNVTLRHVEPRVSPPRASPLRISPPREPSPAISVPQQAISPPPAPPMNIPPPPPPSSGIPPPPPPREGSEERRTSAGKRIMSANNVPQLDAREELMMAIRQFGGSSGKLRRSPNPFN